MYKSNNISNTTFYVGDVKKPVPTLNSAHLEKLVFFKY